MGVREGGREGERQGREGEGVRECVGGVSV